MAHESDSIVIIPTYNEKENIENIVRAVFDLEKCFHILIIDDVCTTGATIISCAETLIKAAGKMKISVLTVGFAHD